MTVCPRKNRTGKAAIARSIGIAILIPEKNCLCQHRFRCPPRQFF